MCIICIDLIKNKLTPSEARRNLKEMIEDISEDHFVEVLDLIDDIENKETE